jgi:ABC-type lipoprotein release transport system permease subunit
MEKRNTSSDYRAIIVVRMMLKFAWKDLRTRRGRSALVVIALALSIAGISGVRGAVTAALDALHQGSRASLETRSLRSSTRHWTLCAKRESNGRWSRSP